jgi:hypothetical protein
VLPNSAPRRRAQRAAGERSELAEHRRFDERRAERNQRAVAEDRLPVGRPLIRIREILQRRRASCSLHDAAGDLEATVAIERIDAEDAAAAGTRRDRKVAADERRDDGS